MAKCLALLISVETLLWCFEQTPVLVREDILPLSFINLRSVTASKYRGTFFDSQKRQTFFVLTDSGFSTLSPCSDLSSVFGTTGLIRGVIFIFDLTCLITAMGWIIPGLNPLINHEIGI